MNADVREGTDRIMRRAWEGSQRDLCGYRGCNHMRARHKVRRLATQPSCSCCQGRHFYHSFTPREVRNNAEKEVG